VVVTAKPPTPSQSFPSAAELEVLRKQLKCSEMTISELKGLVERLAMENSELKTRIDSQPIPEDVQL